MSNVINAELLRKMFLYGAKNLENNKEKINELNVFPVPDGDTGTNMTLTILSAAKELTSLTDTSLPAVCKAASSGSLRGARGNSGVILSQLIRGFTKVISKLDKEELTVADLTLAAENGVKTAYKAVMAPKEGTILTVANGIYKKAAELNEAGVTDMDKFLQEVIAYGNKVLDETPELLPVLKQAGVVDSGGAGLMALMEGAYDAFIGKKIDLNFGQSSPKKEEEPKEVEVKFAYEVDFTINLSRNFNIKNEIDFKAYMESIGDTISIVVNDEKADIHVNTNDPGLVMQKALKYGELNNIKIVNLKIPDSKEDIKKEEKPKDLGPKKTYGFITVSTGKGINEIFESLGVDYIIEGGQTMNPSTDDMLKAIDNVNAENIFILPNNKNIILAANQARDLTKDKNIIVIPTKTIPQGITAVINFIEDIAPLDNETAMTEGVQGVKTGQVTYAVRDTVIDEKEIHKDDFMGIGDKGILSVGKEMNDVTAELIDNLVDDDSELITIYYGEDVSNEDADAFKETIAKKYSGLDIELQYGGQPIYYYIISVE